MTGFNIGPGQKRHCHGNLPGFPSCPLETVARITIEVPGPVDALTQMYVTVDLCAGHMNRAGGAMRRILPLYIKTMDLLDP